MLARCAWRTARRQRDPNRREGKECSYVAAVQPCSFVQITHTDLTGSARQMGERPARQTEAGEWDPYLGDGGRKEHWYLCVDASQRRSLYINVLILN